MSIKSLLTTSVLFLCCCLNVYSQWTQMVFPDTNNVKAITFTNASTGFCTGQYFDFALGDYIGIIYKTTDAGLSWDTVLNTGLGNNYANDITFFNENIGYTSNRNANFFRTTDGGASWDTLPFAGDNALWTAITLIDANSGYSCGFSGEIIKFEDAGETVTTLYSSGVVMEICRDMICLSSDTCYSLWQNEILTTTNGGTTWQTILTSDTTGNTSFYVFDDGTIVVFTKYESITCLRSTNNGASWEITPITATTAAINKVTFFEETGYAVSADGIILQSIDSGRTWNAVPVITPSGENPAALNDIYLFNAYTGFICGDNGTLLSLGLPTAISSTIATVINITPNPSNNLITIT
ncbi:MAG TPA: YCF48-related protein, partial [Chitinophagales bacterium]|nr:YCF48-related protein [Chitinophagales bacterium]